MLHGIEHGATDSPGIYRKECKKMKNYYFRTACTMKHYNCHKWYIMRDYVKDIIIASNSVKEAIERYRSILDDKYCITISNHAMTHKEPLYEDEYPNGCAKQTGYVLTGKTGFESRSDNVPYTEQYIDVWATINLLEDAF